MAYREVTMIEVKEVLRRWLAGAKRKRIAAEVGLDPKTVRRYIGAAVECGLAPEGDGGKLTEEELVAVLARLRGETMGRPRGERWAHCEAERAFIERHLGQGVRLSKVAKRDEFLEELAVEAEIIDDEEGDAEKGVHADEWLATFADPMRAQSAIDRFTSNAYDLEIEGESYRSRLKPKLSTKGS
jgi:transposase